MANIDEIVQALSTNRAEFGKMFRDAQAELLIEERRDFEVLGRNMADNPTAYKAALLYAERKGFLVKFMELAAASLESGGISKALIEELAKGGNATLQAMVSPQTGFKLPDQQARGILNGIKWTGKILINGRAMGTGVLIGPNLFLTAWHVVSELFEESFSPDGSIAYEPKIYTAAQRCPLVVQFDDLIRVVNGSMQPPQPKMVEAHEDWHVCHCACHPDELGKKLPADKNGLLGFWDYAVIRLSKPFGLERRWATLNKMAVVPPDNGNITLFQHPAGLDLKVDENRIRTSAIPRIRFLHQANSLGGSSGGPCFDKEFSLVGIHQGTWPEAIEEEKMNRGVPITCIIEHINEAIKKLPLHNPKDNPLWIIDKTRLVIGCDEFVAALWELVMQDEKRLLSIKGGEKTGKTFLVEVLNAVLPDADHLKIILSAGDISKLKPLEIIKRICSVAGAAMPDFTPYEDYNTSTAAWLKDELVFKALAAINTARNGRLAWFCITDLNKYTIEDGNSSDLLFMLYEQLLNNSWLRIVLDGLRIPTPRSVRDLGEQYDTRAKTKQDLLDCAGRMAEALGLLPAQVLGDAAAQVLFDNYQAQLNSDPLNALPQLAEQSRESFEEALDKIKV